MLRVSDQTPGWRHGTATGDRLPGDAVEMGPGDRAVHPGARPEHPRGADNRSHAGPRWAGDAGGSGVDTTTGLAGLPLDARARPLPVAWSGCCLLRHPPARDPRAAALRRDRRHAGTALLGQGAWRCRAV